MWDVAIIEALAQPDLAKESLFVTPDDNLQREIRAYTWIDVEGMKKRYWQVMDAFVGKDQIGPPPMAPALKKAKRRWECHTQNGTIILDQ